MYNFDEAFKSLDEVEDNSFPLNKDGIEDLKDFINNEDDEEAIKIIDPEATTEEELLDSYVGKAILDCCVCHTKIYKDKKDIVITKEKDEELANIGDACPYCYSEDGYKIIGEIAEFNNGEEEKKEETPAEETAEEETAEETSEETATEETASEENKEEEEKKDDLGEGLENTEKPLTESTQLNEGPGAGYTVEGTIKNVKVVGIVNTGLDVDKDFGSDIVKFKTNIDAELEDVTFNSYSYGGKLKKTPISIYYLTLDAEGTKDYTDKDWEDYAKDALEGAKIKAILGGGYSHSTFDGTIEAHGREIVESDELFSVYFDMPDKNAVDYIDRAVQGENTYTDFAVYAKKEFIQAFATKEEAIEFARNNEEATRVVKFETTEDFEGNEIGNYEEEVWTKDVDESVEEPKKLTEATNEEPMRIFMNTWANYNENGADLSRYGVKNMADGWLTLEDAIKFRDEHADDEPFINDTDNVPIELGENDTMLLDKLLELEKEGADFEIINAIMNDGYDFDKAVDKYEDHSYIFYPGVTSDEELGYAIIDEIGSIKDAVSHPEYYIDEDAMKRDYEDDVREMIRDDAKFELGDDATEEDIEKYIEDNLDSYLDSIVGEEIEMAQRGEIDLSNYFDYEAFGRDCRFDGYSYTDDGAILVEKLNVKKPKHCRKKHECKELTEAMKKFIESKKTIKESLENVKVEADENTVAVDTDNQNINVEQEDGKIKIEVENKEVTGDTIVPLDDEQKTEIENASEENKAEKDGDDIEDDVVDIELDDFDDDSFDTIGEGYLKRVYENVNSYKTVKHTVDGSRVVVEGVIEFKSGAKKKTSFVFEAGEITKSGKMRFIGENTQISNGKKTFSMSARANEKKIVCESMSYNYRAGEGRRVFGTVRNK